MVSTTVTGVAWVPVVTTDSARGLPSAGFAKALIMFSGFIMPILAQVDTCSPRGSPVINRLRAPRCAFFFSCRSQSSMLSNFVRLCSCECRRSVKLE